MSRSTLKQVSAFLARAGAAGWVSTVWMGLSIDLTLAQGSSPPTNPAVVPAGPPVTNPFELRDGDRVVLVGDSFMEQELQWGYLETRLTLQYPDRAIRFCNLGWIRVPALSDPATHSNAAGPAWTRLVAELTAFKPTVAVVAYGTEAAQKGEAHLGSFLTSYMSLLDGLTAAGATNPTRWVLLGPARLELGSSTTNQPAGGSGRGAGPYNAALQELANRRQAWFISLSGLLAELPRYGITNRLTDDQDALTQYGFRLLVDLLTTRLGWEANIWRAGITRDGRFREGGYGIAVADLLRTTNCIRFTGRLEQLPSPPVWESNRPLPGLGPPGTVQFVGLSTEPWELKIDGRPVRGLLGPLWSRGVGIDSGPDSDQAEELRQAIVQKNRLVCQRLETAQPDQAAALDQQVEALYQRIARLRVPVRRTYELVPVPAAAVRTNVVPGP